MGRSLVLGGSVFVGRHLVDHLQVAGHDVAVLNRGITVSEVPAGVEHLVADRTDRAAVAQVLAGRQWDSVFDVSGFVMAAGGADFSALLELMDGNIGAYVYVSSIMAYDQSQIGHFPWTEELSVDRSGPHTYGGFKAMVETKLLDRCRATAFPASIARPAAIYGPDNNIFDMETAMFLRLGQDRPVLVPHSGLVVGSYGHVGDLAVALMAMAESADAPGEIFNVSGDAVSALRYVAGLAEIVGRQPEVVLVPDDVIPTPDAPAVYGHLFGMRHHAVLSSAKLRDRLGIEPQHDFRSGHEDTYRWFQAQGWEGLSQPLSDPMWKASWNFDAEAELASEIKARR
jgi:nucleoside-diphosphate-sugar epimerase